MFYAYNHTQYKLWYINKFDLRICQIDKNYSIRILIFVFIAVFIYF